MSTSSRARPWWLACALMGICAAACSRSHRCEDAERCDGRDNDCDGEVDEDFVDDEGRYTGDAHCGRCGVDCAEAFPTAARAACELNEEGAPQCVLLECPPGEHPNGEGGCAPDVTSLCLVCEQDADCEAFTPGAQCLDVAGIRRCGQPCEMGCPDSFACRSGQCFPDPGLCTCEDVDTDFELPCLVEGEAEGVVCAGVRSCGPGGLGVCELTAEELCNEEDDDCDGEADEDFRDAEGRYVTPLHCGGCGRPCAEPGPNYVAECSVDSGAPRCVVECAEGFVDVDGVRANGCECRRFDGQNAPVVVGGDLDCDGEPDDDDRFVHVTNAGDDANPGTILLPMRTLDAALARGAAEDKVVLVARGVYPAFSIHPGVNLFGGYRPDFRDRDTELYPVFVESEDAEGGTPALICEGVDAPTVVEGFTVVGQPGRRPGQGSTAAVFRACTDAVTVRDVTVLSARGADGEAGEPASSRLPAGVGSLEGLDGADGEAGQPGDDNGIACTTRAGGAGGRNSCGGRDVSGGAGAASGCPDLDCVQGEPCANAGCSDFTSNGVCDMDRVSSLAVANPAAEDGRGSEFGRGGGATYDSPTNRNVCNFCDDNPTLRRAAENGGDGVPGPAGEGGEGCQAPSLQFDDHGRATAPRGGEGTAGGDGSGGGGGSAGAGFSRIDGTTGSCDDNAGGSGGGGGSGGCGAPAGGGGGGGGASVGILLQLLDAGPSFEQVRVISDSGGRGGDGGNGAAGGRAGVGAPGGTNNHWCARAGGRGGDGGSGGAGGGGGGGCGGASHAVVVVGAPPGDYVDQLATTLEIERPGVAGQGGRGGAAPDASGAAGARGRADAIWQIVPEN